MLNRGSNYVTAMRDRRLTQTSNREIVRFSAAGSEHDLVLLRANQRRDFASRTIDRRACLLSKPVHTRRVAERLHHCARHRIRDARIDRRRRAMIEINSAFRHQITPKLATPAQKVASEGEFATKTHQKHKVLC